MPQYDELFELIHSLDKAELQHCVKHFKLHNQQHNLSLFNYLKKAKNYSSRAIQRELKTESFIGYLSRQKNQLHKEILFIMRSISNDKNAEQKLLKHLSDFAFLRSKNLHQQIDKRLKKAKKLAKAENQSYYLLKLLSIEKDLFTMLKGSKVSEFTLYDLNHEYLSELHKLRMIWKYRILNSMLTLTYALYQMKDEREIQQRIEYVFNEHFVSDPIPSDIFIKYYYLQVYLLYYLYAGDYKSAFNYSCQQLKLLDELNVKSLTASTNKAIIYVNSISIGFHASVSKETMDKLIHDTEVIIENAELKDKRAVILNELYFWQVIYYNHANQLSKSQQIINKLIERKRLSPKLYMAVASYYFATGQYDKATDYTSQVFQFTRKQITDKIYYNTLILEILSLYEVDSTFQLDSSINTMDRFFQKREFNNDVNKAFISAIRKLNKIYPRIPKKENPILEKLFNEVKDISISEFMISVNLIKWLEQKLGF